MMGQRYKKKQRHTLPFLSRRERDSNGPLQVDFAVESIHLIVLQMGEYQ